MTNRQITTLILTSLSSASFCLGEIEDRDLERITEIRDKEILNIDKLYLKALEDLKQKHLKASDLEKAVNVDTIIKDLTKSIDERENDTKPRNLNDRWFIGTKLRQINGNNPAHMLLKEDKTAIYFWREKVAQGGNLTLENDVLTVKWANGIVYRFEEISETTTTLTMKDNEGKKTVVYKQ